MIKAWIAITSLLFFYQACSAQTAAAAVVPTTYNLVAPEDVYVQDIAADGDVTIGQLLVTLRNYKLEAEIARLTMLDSRLAITASEYVTGGAFDYEITADRARYNAAVNINNYLTAKSTTEKTAYLNGAPGPDAYFLPTVRTTSSIPNATYEDRTIGQINTEKSNVEVATASAQLNKDIDKQTHENQKMAAARTQIHTQIDLLKDEQSKLTINAQRDCVIQGRVQKGFFVRKGDVIAVLTNK